MNSREDPRGCRGASSGNPGSWRRRPRPLEDQPYRDRGRCGKPPTLRARRLSWGPGPQHRRAQSPRSVPGLCSPGSFPAAASAARSPSPAFQGPPPHPPAAATGRCFGQSKLRSCVPATNSRRLEAGLLRSHPSSSRGPRIPFVWESQTGIELASLPGGSTLLRPAGVCARSVRRQGSATFPSKETEGQGSGNTLKWLNWVFIQNVKSQVSFSFCFRVNY